MPAKAKKNERVEDHTTEEEHYPLFRIVRKVLLAGIGAVALAQDEIEDFINHLIERGEIAELDGRKLIREIMEKRTKGARKAEDEFNRHFEKVLGRLNVPTKADLDGLSEKIAALSRKVDDMKK